jgi:hypothetical protein
MSIVQPPGARRCSAAANCMSVSLGSERTKPWTVESILQGEPARGSNMTDYVPGRRWRGCAATATIQKI